MNAQIRTPSFSLTPASVFGALERAISQVDTGSYPPFNVIRLDDNTFLIEMAVAGFAEEQIDISVEKRQLTVVGKPAEQEEPNYLHKGIARRAFRRAFQLGQYVEVVDAKMTNGLLSITLKREIPEAELPRRVEIARH